MKMRFIVSAFVLFFICGCADKERVNPYVSMINVYMDELDDWDYSSEQPPPAPPVPAFASTSTIDLPGPIGPYNSKHYPTGSFNRPDNGIPKMSESVFRINEINNERQAAYNAALKKYKSVADRFVKENGG